MKLRKLIAGIPLAKKIATTFFFASLLATNVHAQNPCLVNSLTINTGYDPVTNTTLAPGTPDPNWTLTAGTPAFLAASGATPGPAIVTPAAGTWVTSATSGWISYAATGSTGYLAPTGSTYEMDLERTFTLCSPDDVTFRFNIARDNYILDILIDGVPTGIHSEAANATTTNYSSFTSGALVTHSLPAGLHTIRVISGNFGVGTAATAINNPHGINIVGTISTLSNSIVGPNCSPDINPCHVPPVTNCSDTCYWKVTGNNILNGNNIFGTLTNDNVRIQTNGLDRGTFDQNGLIGWNTMAPTAYLHVDCQGHNPNNGMISDIRFENLERGKGNILVIDDAGYVYDSKIPIQQVFHMAKTNEELTEQNNKLQEDLQVLNAKLDAILETRSDLRSATENILYQNNPNPFSKETTVAYDIKKMNTSAAMKIYDLNGKELRTYPISTTGAGKIVVNQGELSAGMYLYSLIVDGQECATKRMVLTK